jgi:hypothetical protein
LVLFGRVHMFLHEIGKCSGYVLVLENMLSF